MIKDEWYKQLFENLGKPTFRSRFHLKQADIEYINKKWHKIQPGKQLSQVQQDYLVDVIMTWIRRELEGKTKG